MSYKQRDGRTLYNSHQKSSFEQHVTTHSPVVLENIVFLNLSL